MIINVDKQHSKISSVFPETGEWTVKMNTYENRNSLRPIADAVSRERVLYVRVEDESGLLEWTTVQSLWSNTLQHGPANIQDSLLWQVPRTLERLQMWLNCTKVYVVDTHYSYQMRQLTPKSEWVTHLKLARLTIIRSRSQISTAGPTATFFSSIIRTQVTSM